MIDWKTKELKLLNTWFKFDIFIEFFKSFCFDTYQILTILQGCNPKLFLAIPKNIEFIFFIFHFIIIVMSLVFINSFWNENSFCLNLWAIKFLELFISWKCLCNKSKFNISINSWLYPNKYNYFIFIFFINYLNCFICWLVKLSSFNF